MSEQQKLQQQVEELQKTLDILKKKISNNEGFEIIEWDEFTDGKFKLKITGESFHRETKEGKVMSLVSFQAPKNIEKQTRNSLDLVTVLDKSGSMEGPKMKNMLHALDFAVKQLQADDTLTIVLFDSSVTCPLLHMKQDLLGKEQSRNIIKSIRCGSCTNLCGGISRGLDEIMELQKKFSGNRDTLMICFTDGIANEGAYQTTDGLVGLVKSYIQPNSGKEPLVKTKIHTFGFGGDHNLEALKGISEMGRGMYYYISKEESIPSAIADCLAGMLSVCAQNIKLTITPKNGASIVQFMTKYEIKEQDGSFVIELGDLFLEERRDIPIKLVLPENHQETHQYLEVSVSYLDVTEDIPSKNNAKSHLSFNRTNQKISETPNIELAEHINRWTSITHMEEAQKLGSVGQYQQGQQKLQQAIEKIRNSIAPNTELSKYLISELQKVSDNMNNSVDYESAGKYMCTATAQSSARQRSCVTDAHESNVYSNTKQVNFRLASAPPPKYHLTPKKLFNNHKLSSSSPNNL